MADAPDKRPQANKPTRRTSKLQVWWALGLGTLLFVFAGFAVCLGIDTRALDSLIWAAFSIVAVGLGVYQTIGAIDHLIARRAPPQEPKS